MSAQIPDPDIVKWCDRHERELVARRGWNCPSCNKRNHPESDECFKCGWCVDDDYDEAMNEREDYEQAMAYEHAKQKWKEWRHRDQCYVHAQEE